MRKNPPEPERRMWNALRRSQLEGHKFRRQAIIGARIVDFYCPAKGVIVEIDGDTHDADRDHDRDIAMQSEFGFRTIRFSNHDVAWNIDGVLENLRAILNEAPDRWAGRTTPQPPPLKRRGSSVADALRAAAERLSATSDTARLDAELLMAHALGVSRSDLLLKHMHDTAPEDFDPLVDRRAQHEPIALIIGRQEFFGLDLTVTPDTLIPRGDSETIVLAALEAAPDAARVLDLGTGTGALLLAYLHEREGARGIGIDASERALAVARANAERLGLAGRTGFRLASWHEPGWADGLGRFDLILCNPPYVEIGAKLDPDVRDYEPASALFAGPEGLDDYRAIVPQLGKLLFAGGLAVLEIGATQAESVSRIARESGFAAELRNDLGGRPRALILR
jgi:release factor glutamine methyltransferase